MIIIPKVFLSPSDQKANVYAYGDTNEAVQCNLIANSLSQMLHRCGIDTRINDNMYSAVAESNAWNADLHLAIHTNAFNGVTHGVRVFSFDDVTEGHGCAKVIYDDLCRIIKGSNALKAAPELYEVRNTIAPCVYVEVDFHDVPEVAKWLIESTDLIAETLCRSICKLFGIETNFNGGSFFECPYCHHKLEVR